MRPGGVEPQRNGRRIARLAVLLLAVIGLPFPLGPLRSGLLAQTPSARLDRQAHLIVEDLPLEEALEALGRSSGTPIGFSPDVLPPRHRATCICGDVTVRIALDRLLAGTGLRYVERGPRILIAPGPGAESGTSTLGGVVVEAGADTPAVGALVQLNPGRRRTLSDGNGRFVLDSLSSGEYTLRVTAVGFAASDTVVTAGRDGVAEIRVALRRTPILLAEVVVTPGSFSVLDESPAVSGTVAGREEIEASPTLGDDPFRVLAGVPGVSTNDVSAKLSVRGGTAEDLLVRLDGVELLEPYHLPELDGVFGIVDVQALGSIELMTGGVPLELGDRWAGVFDMRTREPPQSGARTTAGLSLSSLSLISQGTAFGGRGRWLASLRRGSLDLLLGLSGVKDDLSPRYWDLLSKAEYFLSDRHRVSVEILYAGDQLVWRDRGAGGRIDSRWTSGYAWLTWDATFAPGFRATTLASVSRLTRDRTGEGGISGDGVLHPYSSRVRDESRSVRLGLRHDWRVDVARDVTLKAGFEVRAGSSDYDYAGYASLLEVDQYGRIGTEEKVRAIAGEPRERALGVYAAARWKTGGSLTWEAGIRYDSRSHTGDADLSPRITARWEPAPRSSLTASLGRYFRSQGLHELNVADGESDFHRAEQADQAALGFERDFGGGVTGRAEAYYREVDRVLPEFVNLGRDLNPLAELENDRALIAPTLERAGGMGLVFQWRAGSALSLGAHYALAWAKQEVRGSWVPGMFDQRHTLHIQASYRPGTRWQFGVAWHYHSGWPVSEPIFRVVTGTVGSGPETATVILREWGPLNTARLPPYHRMDVRVTRRFQARASHLEAYLDVFNVYGRENVQGFRYNIMFSPGGRLETARRNGMQLLPILPTLGFRWEF